ncbi:MAG TPA: pyridoxamine 5'-phosphate oxidase [Gemmatales bacterium]|nr:pyridoxamine 5'-phosphate oxidase [Gemmatales bacterium]HMP61083.1 pyridoxamine 5'-phosphate oxidase [Gemmatales bacterium]
MNLADRRREYRQGELDERHVEADPLVQFHGWLTEALKAEVLEPYAMTLATVGADGRPAARIVLLRQADAKGFSFFTNYTSRKGRELADRSRAALVFYWAELERQVRVEGRVEPVSASESDAYFAARPRGSQLAAWASAQSEVIPNRIELERLVAEVAERFGSGPIPRPPQWGGYRLVPDHIEFWQGRESRLHDRLLFTRTSETAAWVMQRLAP